MTTAFNIFDERGFTIQEILVVLLVNSLLLSFGLSLYLMVEKSFQSWQRRTEVNGEVNRIADLVALDIQKSTSVAQLNDSSFTLLQGLAGNVAYVSSGNSMWRNGVKVGSGDATSIIFHVSRPAITIGRQDSVGRIDVEVIGISGRTEHRAHASVNLGLASRQRVQNNIAALTTDGNTH